MVEINNNTTWRTLFNEELIDVRVLNCAQRAGFVTIQDLIDFINEGSDLSEIWGCGKKTLKTFLRYAKKYGNLSVGSTKKVNNKDNENITKANAVLFFNKLSSREKNILDYYYAIPSETSDLCKLFKAEYPDYKAFILSILIGMPELTEILNQLSFDKKNEFIEIILYILDCWQNTNSGTTSYWSKLQAAITAKQTDILLLKGDYLLHQLKTEEKLDSAENWIKCLAQKRLESKKVEIIKNSFSSYKSLLKYIYLERNNFDQISPVITRKVLQNIHDFLCMVRKDIPQIHTLSIDEINLIFEQEEFPYLNSFQIRFLKEYKEKNGCYPLLFVAYYYICASDNKADNIFCDYHGLEYEFKSVSTIARERHLSIERVRQILRAGVCATTKSYLQNYTVDFETYFSDSYISVDDFFVKEVVAKESLDLQFDSIVALIKVVFDAELYSYKDKCWLLSHDIAQIIKESKIVENINIILKNDKRSTDTRIEFNDYFNVNEDKKAIQFIARFYEDNVDVMLEDDGLIVRLNVVNISNAVKQILGKAKKPLSLEDLYNQFCSQYKTTQKTSFKVFKTKVLSYSFIKKIGYNYGLSHWDMYVPKSIRDCLIHILEQSDTPIRPDKLTKKIQFYYPTTTQRSLVSSMQVDQDNRFVRYNNEFYGLKNKKYDEKYVPDVIPERITFEDRIVTLELFIETYHRFPLNNSESGEEEASLANWYGRIKRREYNISSKEKERLNLAIAPYLNIGYPEDGNEYSFWERCEEYKEYVAENFELPDNKNQKHEWMRKQLDRYDNNLFEGNKKVIFENFLLNLQTYGFFTNYVIRQNNLSSNLSEDETMYYRCNNNNVSDTHINLDNLYEYLDIYEEKFASLKLSHAENDNYIYEIILLIAVFNLISSNILNNDFKFTSIIEDECHKVEKEFNVRSVIQHVKYESLFNSLNDTNFWHYSDNVVHINCDLLDIIQEPIGYTVLKNVLISSL